MNNEMDQKNDGKSIEPVLDALQKLAHDMRAKSIYEFNKAVNVYLGLTKMLISASGLFISLSVTLVASNNFSSIQNNNLVGLLIILSWFLLLLSAFAGIVFLTKVSVWHNIGGKILDEASHILLVETIRVKSIPGYAKENLEKLRGTAHTPEFSSQDWYWTQMVLFFGGLLFFLVVGINIIISAK